MTAPAALRIYLDANILIYLIEGYAEHEPALQVVLAEFERGDSQFVTSELSLAEVLVQPLRQKRNDLVDKYENLLAPEAGIETKAIDATILRRSADLRANLGGSLMDAIHLATAAFHNCSIILSEDNRLKVPAAMKRLSLSDFAGQFSK